MKPTLKRITAKHLVSEIDDKNLLHNLDRSKELVLEIMETPEPKTDSLVKIEIAFRKCLRMGALRK